MLEILLQQVENDHFLPWNALKCVVGWGSAPNPTGEHTAPQKPLAVEGRGANSVSCPRAHMTLAMYASGRYSQTA